MDVLTAYKDASSSGAAYPPHPTKWIPDEDATAEDLIHDRKTILNLPPEVISVLSHAVGRLEDKLEEFPSNEFLTMLKRQSKTVWLTWRRSILFVRECWASLWMMLLLMLRIS
ncbi:unnamed protein product [Durusdinium trenchii]|uniref:Uncharacterized protein n=1 Tax=Durusdinium trenchii TaxID=1381693 RepID=A0ABP0I127_9DINO